MYLRVRISQYGVLSVSLRDEGMQMNAFVFRVPANSLACLNGHHALNLKPPKAFTKSAHRARIRRNGESLMGSPRRDAGV